MGKLLTFASSFTFANAGTDADLMSIQPADDYPCYLRKITISQVGEVAEAAEEDLRINIHRMGATFTVGSGGSAVTARAVKDYDSTTGAPTVRVNDTTIATTSGTDETLEELGWNVRATPLIMEWSHEEAPSVRQGSAFVLYCPTTPADDIVMQVTVVLEVM